MRQTTFSETIRKLRNKSGYTQAELSSKLNIQRQTYCNYENATRTPPLEIIIALAELYQVSVDYLVRGTEDFPDRKAPAFQMAQRKRLFEDFSSLPEAAQKEVLDFIHFKKTCSE